MVSIRDIPKLKQDNVKPSQNNKRPMGLNVHLGIKQHKKEMYFFLSGRKIKKLLMFKDVWYKSEWFIRYKLFMCLGEQNNYPLPQTKKKSLIEIYINPFKYWCKKINLIKICPIPDFFVKKLKMLIEDVCIKTDY